MSITAKELAEKLGLSAAAVSMALNNKPGVSESTRDRVLKAAREYDFDFGRQRIREEADKGSIALLMYRRHGAVVGDTLFFSALSEGISNACRAAGYRMNLQYLHEENLRVELRNLLSSDTKGILLVGTEMRGGDFAPFVSLPLPLVVLDSYFEGIPRDCVLINNVQGAFTATNYLIAKRGKQPGYLRSSYPINNFDERADGFYKAIRYNGMSTSASIVHRLAPSVEGAYADMKVLLAQSEPLASCYFADNDLIAAGAMRAFKEAGYRIPEDIGIVGFDNSAACEMLDPPLTTIHVPKQALGQIAVERLTAIMARKPSANIKIEIETTLIKRKSM
ncbi:MAG: LacI family DNA-binding transcriptional regulator [Clostridiales bacterium]|nr:LacI family DNA-binding transcriptional regulator [Clostridiales bacterium]